MNKYDEAMKQLNGNLGWVCDEKSALMVPPISSIIILEIYNPSPFPRVLYKLLKNVKHHFR